MGIFVEPGYMMSFYIHAAC